MLRAGKNCDRLSSRFCKTIGPLGYHISVMRTPEAWAGSAAKCGPCARRSYAHSAEHRGIPAWPARCTVMELATGIEHGTLESEAEVAACLAFAKFGADDVEIVSDASPMARFTA